MYLPNYGQTRDSEHQGRVVIIYHVLGQQTEIQRPVNVQRTSVNRITSYAITGGTKGAQGKVKRVRCVKRSNKSKETHMLAEFNPSFTTKLKKHCKGTA